MTAQFIFDVGESILLVKGKCIGEGISLVKGKFILSKSISIVKGQYISKV